VLYLLSAPSRACPPPPPPPPSGREHRHRLFEWSWRVRCETVISVSEVVEAAVPAAVCR